MSLILLFDFIFIPGFFSIENRDGNLYGSLIDIFRNGSTVMLLAIGMTLVIATGGVDLSVGAVMAIAASIAGILMNPSALKNEVFFVTDPTYTFQPLWVVISAALFVSILCGLWNGMLVGYMRIQPMVATLILMISGRGIAQLITNGLRVQITYEPYCIHRAGLDYPAFFFIYRAFVFSYYLGYDSENRHRHVHRIGGHQFPLQFFQRDRRKEDQIDGVHLLRLLRWDCRAGGQLKYQDIRFQ